MGDAEIGTVPRRWHPGIHEAFGKENLYLVRFAFQPTYQPHQIVAAIAKVLSDQGVQSYELTELIGTYDMLLQLWVDSVTQFRSIDSGLRSALGPLALDRFEPLSVSGTPQMWVGREGFLQLVPCPSDAPTPADVHVVANPNQHRAEIEALELGGHLMPAVPEASVRFVVELVRYERRITIQDHDQFLRSLQDTLATNQTFDHVVVITGDSGTWGSPVLIGAAPLAVMMDFDGAIVKPLRELSSMHSIRIRTATHLFSRVRPLQIKETVSTGVSPGSNDAFELPADESSDVEFKGSVRFDWKRYLATGVNEVNKSLMFDSLVRPVAAMLNSGGGQLVIGVLEKSRVPASAFESYLADIPQLGDLVLVGIDRDMDSDTWDHYSRMISDYLAAHIEPTIAGAIRIRREQLQGQPLMVLSITATSSLWYYCSASKGDDKHFYVRQGASTVKLDGVNADQYRESFRRVASVELPRSVGGQRK